MDSPPSQSLDSRFSGRLSPAPARRLAEAGRPVHAGAGGALVRERMHAGSDGAAIREQTYARAGGAAVQEHAQASPAGATIREQTYAGAAGAAVEEHVHAGSDGAAIREQTHAGPAGAAIREQMYAGAAELGWVRGGVDHVHHSPGCGARHSGAMGRSRDGVALAVEPAGPSHDPAPQATEGPGGSQETPAGAPGVPGHNGRATDGVDHGRQDAGGGRGGGRRRRVRRRKPEKLFRIGEVVEYSGMSRQTVHNYTTMGLLHEVRWTDGGHRLYEESVFERLDQIAELKAQRKSLQDIREHFARLDGL